MKSAITTLLILAVAFTTPAVFAQQSPSPSPTPAVTSPVVNPGCNPPAATAPKWGFNVPAQLQQQIDRRRQQAQNTAGISTPSTTDLTKQAQAPKPCQPQVPLKPAVLQVATPAPTAVPQTPALKLPPDATITLRCNPLYPSTDANGHKSMLSLPDPHAFALPKANEFEADNVVPDEAAKTPCYLVKVDAKTGKSFIAQ